MLKLNALSARDSRILAVLLLALVLALFYFVAIHWTFVVPYQQHGVAMQDLRDEQLRYRRTIGQREQIEQQLAQVRDYEQGNQAFLAEADTNAAQAGLIQRLKQAVTDHGGGDDSCVVAGSQGYASHVKELYQRVTVQSTLRCDIEPLAAILHDLEGGQPYLFVDRVVIWKGRRQVRRGGPVPPSQLLLNVQINLSGYVRAPGGGQ